MLLTIKQPAHQGYKSFHDYSPPTPPATSRFSPAVTTTSSFPTILNSSTKSLPPLPSAKKSTPQPMSTPHRGLPPPAAMALPQPTQQQAQPQQPPQLSQPMGQLPNPPHQWQGAEESMRNWLHAKAEEDKRKQEEEKTRQETLRLEQRKIEQDMLRTSLTGGIPPYMIPMVFAGMGGGNLPNASLEWAQHYMAQAHQQAQQQQQLLPSQSHASPEQVQRRDSRVQPFGPQQHTLPSTPVAGPGQVAGFVPSYPMSPRTRQAQGVLSRQSTGGQLPRLNTGEIHIQPPVPGPTMHVLPGQPQHPLQQTQSAQPEQQSSPSIYFHHWQPPSTQTATGNTNQPTTPSGKSRLLVQDLRIGANVCSDHTSSPKKRKATGPQQPAPPPTSQPQYTSPSFSHGGSSVSNTPSSRRRGHSRQRSDLSARGGQEYRPSSRHRHTESGYSQQSTGSPHGTSSEQGPAASAEARSGGSNPVSSILEQSDSRPISQAQYQFSAGPEMRHQDKRRTPERKTSR
ncbi:hypothetical protein PVAG01_01707 [Phlyctema vagabunda]|uniref:Uncharacterized protein n=1 Tax=Phlyctema vagabunda TaxID=108571 RepID=A0ABR4PYE7_9HELO